MGLLLLSVLRCEVTIQSLLQIKTRILWYSRFSLGKWFTSLGFYLSLSLAIFALCSRKKIYGLVLVSSWHLISFHSKMALVAGKAPAAGTWSSKLFSINHKEDIVSKGNCWVALCFLAKEEAWHFLIKAVFLCPLFKTQWICQLNKNLKTDNAWLFIIDGSLIFF